MTHELSQVSNQQKTPTSRQHVTSCIAQWLTKYSQIFPMYGKSLSDFPFRFDVFVEEFEAMPPEILDESMRMAVSACSEFPTPADVRKCSAVVIENRHAKELENSARLIASRSEKPDDDTPEQRRAFAEKLTAELNAKVAAGVNSMPKPKSQDYYNATAERIAAERNGKSTMPEDPSKRKEWARETAVRNGWA